MQEGRNFVWLVPEMGFTWVRTDDDLGRFGTPPRWILSEVCHAHGTTTARAYQPMSEHTGLFLTFAETEPTREGIRAFASRYGCLCKVPPAADGRSVLDEEGRAAWPTGELWEMWRLQISDMKSLTDLWQMCRRRDAEGLARHIQWEQPAGFSHDQDRGVSVSFRSHEDYEWGDITPSGHEVRGGPIASRGYHPERFSLFRTGDVVLPALLCIEEQINDHLESRAAPQLVWDAELGHSVLCLMPADLLGALWLQFAQAVSAEKRFKRCRDCTAWFEVSPQTARTNRVFCSSGCRIKAHRGRHAKALEMHSEGKTPREIAKELESDVPTIKKWIQKGR